VIGIVAPLVLGAGGGWLLRASWRDRAQDRPGLLIAGWTLIVAGGVVAAWRWG
jgi:hypothetical protein